VVKFRHSLWLPYQLRVRAVPRLWVLYPGICRTTEEKSKEKNLSHGSRKVTFRDDSICGNDRLLQVTGTSCRSWSPCFRGPGSNPISHIIRHRYTNHRPGLLNSVPWRMIYILVLSMELLHVTLLAPGILRWLLGFWKICLPVPAEPQTGNQYSLRMGHFQFV